MNESSIERLNRGTNVKIVISAENVTKSFGEFRALKGISMSIRSGEFFGCFGPNGAGKTTLLKVMTGQIEFETGTVRVLDLDVASAAMDVKRRIGIVPESESPPSYLTALEFLHFVGHVREIQDIERRVEHWMDFFDLRERSNTLCRDLSKGTRQKVMIASALIHEPKLLFLDEPFINLDPIYQRKLQTHLREHVDGGGTIFMCTHLLEIAEKLCSRVAIIDSGRIVGEGDIKSLKKSPDEDLSDVFMRLVKANPKAR